ncbi:MAG: NADH-ubiquinone oxidoreductase-F iron-sulfur binding region domain-containing protein [Acidimicrobiia bacterium]
MTRRTRVLDDDPVASLDDYRRQRGMEALAGAIAVEPDVIVGLIADAGLRGRGGAGFPTGVKWRTVADNRSTEQATTVVVNGAEGEPGTFKDRTLLRVNPFKVLEGALIAAYAVRAGAVVVALKATFEPEIDRVQRAIEDIAKSGLPGVLPIRIVTGPSEYLFGEESALLEVIEGRPPFPRVTPPYRRGLDEDEPWAGNSSSDVQLAARGGTDEAPTLVDNVETLANVPGIVLNGAAWFRSVGTAESPGTIVCTVSGATRWAGVGEYEMGTSLAEVIRELGGGALPQRSLVAALPGTANGAIAAADFDVALSYESLAALGSGLGSAGFIVIDDSIDPVSVAHGVSRFLAIESCGQCEPCKLDGLEISHGLRNIRTSTASEADLALVERRLTTVSDEARCSVGPQHQVAVASLLALASSSAAEHIARRIPGSEPWLVAPIIDLVDGRVRLDPAQRSKQPDWGHDSDSGQTPATRFENQPVSALMGLASE